MIEGGLFWLCFGVLLFRGLPFRCLPLPAGLFIGSLPWAYGLRLRELEGGRKRVSDTFSTKAVFGALRGAQPLLHALFGVKTLPGTLLGPACNERGLRG